MQPHSAPPWAGVRRMMGEEGWREAVRLFQEDSALYLAQAARAIERADGAEAAQVAHKLASLAAALYCEEELRLARNLEALARVGQQTQLRRFFPQVERAFTRLRERLAGATDHRRSGDRPLD